MDFSDISQGFQGNHISDKFKALSLSVEAARFRLLLTSGLHLLVIFNTTINKIFFDKETFNN